VLIVVESLYSMDGDEAPLEALADFCHAHCCDLVVDEAHATGIMGQQGEGLVQAKGLAACVTARIHTFGKAVGTQGAVILGSQTLKAYLVNFAKPFIYTTALPPVLLQCIRNSYYTFPRMHEARQKVKSLSQYLEEQLVAQGRTVIHGRGPIKALIHVKRLAAHLQEAGFDVRPILAPTVPQGQERLRICLHAYNTFAQLNALLTAIHQYTEATTTSVSPHA
jgi:8-amino-7-oxononanoate synthase